MQRGKGQTHRANLPPASGWWHGAATGAELVSARSQPSVAVAPKRARLDWAAWPGGEYALPTMFVRKSMTGEAEVCIIRCDDDTVRAAFGWHLVRYGRRKRAWDTPYHISMWQRAQKAFELGYRGNNSCLSIKSVCA